MSVLYAIFSHFAHLLKGIINQEEVMCNMMCLCSEWNEFKPRDCSNCSGNYSSAGVILLPQQIERMARQSKRNSEHTETGLSRKIRSKYSYTKHRRTDPKIIRRVLLAEFRLRRE